MAASSRIPASDDGSAPVRWPRVFAVVLTVFLVLEAAARAGVYYYAGKPFDSLSLYRWSPYGLVRNNPELTSPAFEIDRNGFREVIDYERVKPPGTYRIILLGGSVLYAGLAPNRIAGYGRVRSDQTISQYMKAALDADPKLAGRNIEVINAAVNFNRITEISSAYLEQYIQWQPDMVVVFGAVNNFRDTRYAGDFEALRTPLQMDHPWRREFDRLNNDHSLSSIAEHAWRGLAETSAALAVLNKICVRLADRAVALSHRLALASPPPPPQAALESPDEERRYMDLYLAYADAMVAAARRMNQKILFAWEPLLGNLRGSKPFSPEEESIYANVARTPEQGEQYERTRLFLRDYFAREGVGYFDPSEALRTHSGTVFIDYAHYTAGGNRFVGEHLAAQVSPIIAGQP